MNLRGKKGEMKQSDLGKWVFPMRENASASM